MKSKDKETLLIKSADVLNAARAKEEDEASQRGRLQLKEEADLNDLTESAYGRKQAYGEAAKENADFDAEKLLTLLESEEFIENFILGNEKIERAVIESYLKKRAVISPHISGGFTPAAPPKKPKTLEEAKRLCDRILSL